MRRLENYVRELVRGGASMHRNQVDKCLDLPFDCLPGPADLLFLSIEVSISVDYGGACAG